MSYKCPHRQTTVISLWRPLYPLDTWEDGQLIPLKDRDFAKDSLVGRRADVTYEIKSEWMQCTECGGFSIRIRRSRIEIVKKPEWITSHRMATSVETRIVEPRHSNRSVDPVVTEKEPGMAKDFLEAALILNDSPRMSAVLARRVADDLLEKYAGRREHFIGQKLEEFAKDNSYSLDLRDSLKALNQLGIFGAHTKMDRASGDPVVLDVTTEQAEWTLNVVERLFEALIIEPERNRAMHKAVEDMRLRAQGKSPVGPDTPQS
jgi:hypothetical protein